MSENEHIIDNQALHLLQETAQYFNEHPRQQAYLVGGSLRNILLGEEYVDWDIVTTGDAHKSAQQLADRLGGSYVRMHEKASRVVVLVGNPVSFPNTKEIHFDVSPLNGKTIEDDLRQRDFTINALATPLSEIVSYLQSNEAKRPQGSTNRSIVVALPVDAPLLPPDTPSVALGRLRSESNALYLIDPLNGLTDLASRRLKAVNENVFQRDPL